MKYQSLKRGCLFNLFSEWMSSHKVFVSAFFISLSIIYSLYAITHEATENTRISENALLAGLTDETFQDTSLIQRYIRLLRKRLETNQSFSSFVLDEFEILRIESHLHHYSFEGLNLIFRNGSNVVGVVRSFRASSVETILITVPMGEFHIDSMAVSLAFANHASKQTYWARDIIFLFVDEGETFALESWLSSYHRYQQTTDSLTVKHPSSRTKLNIEETSGVDLPVAYGQIIAAIAIDIVGSVFSSVELQFGMINWRLPNLDLVNLFVLLAEKMGTKISFYGVEYDPRSRNQINYYINALKTMIRSTLTQGLVEYEGLGSLFGNYGIDGITLKMRHNSGSADASFAINQLDAVRILEGGVRSLNNILEKFHQSYFFYLIPHSNKFISIAYYIPLIGLLLSPFIILGFCEWALITDAKIEKMMKSAYFFFTMHAIAFALYWLQSEMYKNQTKLFGFNVSPDKVTIFGLFLPLIFLFVKIDLIPNVIFHCSRFLLTVEFILLVLTISLINYPLSILISIFLSPIILLTLITNSLTPFWKRSFLLILFNPLTLFALIYVISHLEAIETCLHTNSKKRCIAVSMMNFEDSLVHHISNIMRNHFKYSSAIFFVLSIPSYSMYLISAKILTSK